MGNKGKKYKANHLNFLMADTGIFATTAQIGYKAGANASATSKAEAYTNFYIAGAESYINLITRYNWSDAYSTLNVDVKYILQEAASNLAAIYVINYDMTNFNSRAEAELMIKVLYRRFMDCIKVLVEQKVETFAKKA
jgi:hypothetical protein